MGNPVLQRGALTEPQFRPNSSFTVLGVRVHAVQICDVVAQMERWISDRKGSHFVAVTGMHGVSVAQHELSFKQILNSADLVVPDGMPLVWRGRWEGYPLKDRVSGSELMEIFCRATADRYRHFLYGGAPGVPERLAEVLTRQYGTRIVGTYSPPFRLLTEREKQDIETSIEATTPDVLWVGLSTPKQERWMAEYRQRLQVPVLLGVGAAFDFHTGRLRRAPLWMGENGLEWLFRLLIEPRRLWRRYLIGGSHFVWHNLLELLRIKTFT
jgi:N-acetylglucosaminyldiphosphoundecaprenol N-acetyl-beta-D-mannosaminyltransferase